MKSGLILAAATLAQVALAQPHRGHAHQHIKREAVATKVDYVTGSPVVVYVNAQGTPVSTSTEGAVAAKATAAAAPAAPAAPANPAQPAPAKAASSSLNVDAFIKPSKAAAPALPAASSAPASSGGLGGISYSPYNQDNSCKTAQQVASDIEYIAKTGSYSYIRSYGTDCSQVQFIGEACKANNLQMMVGIFDLSSAGSVSSQIASANTQLGGDWSNVKYIGVGNEWINTYGAGALSQVTTALSTVKGYCQSNNINVPVAAVDTFDAIIANPAICQNSDFAAANIHAYFASDISPAGAGQYVYEQYQNVAKACGKALTVVTETGYPWQGQQNGNAIASLANQVLAIGSIKTAFVGKMSDVVLFSAFDDLWETEGAGQFGTNQWFGLYKQSS